MKIVAIKLHFSGLSWNSYLAQTFLLTYKLPIIEIKKWIVTSLLADKEYTEEGINLFWEFQKNYLKMWFYSRYLKMAN